MRRSGKFAAEVLEMAGKLVKPGTVTDDIDKAVKQGSNSSVRVRHLARCTLCTLLCVSEPTHSVTVTESAEAEPRRALPIRLLEVF